MPKPVFSSPECWKRYFRDNITKIFYCGGRFNGKLNYFKLIAINRTIQPLLLNINKWNLKVLIFDLLFSVFQFHICFPNYGYGHMLYSPPKITVSSKLIFWATKSFFRTLRKNQIKSFLVQKFWSAWYKICQWPTRFS